MVNNQGYCVQNGSSWICDILWSWILAKNQNITSKTCVYHIGHVQCCFLDCPGDFAGNDQTLGDSSPADRNVGQAGSKLALLGSSEVDCTITVKADNKLTSDF